MSGELPETRLAERRKRMAETVRQVLITRERAPRSPGMERALKRLIWRYTRPVPEAERASDDAE